MSSYKPDQLLAQIPLTVSPFISLPTAPALSYNYRQIPSTLPPSLLSIAPSSSSSTSASSSSSSNRSKPAYVTSRTGHAAHPDEIIDSCTALQKSLIESDERAARAVKDWKNQIRERELAEKRKVAPGWLDREEKLLTPSHKPGEGEDLMEGKGGEGESRLDEVAPAMQPRNEGMELDAAFGGLKLSR